MPNTTKILVVCGGENPLRMALPSAMVLAALKFDVTAIDNKLTFDDIKNCEGKIKTHSQIENLRERLHEWDIIVTHYGFTAFEALAAGCLVILISPTNYHYQLAIASGFTALPQGIPTVSDFTRIFSQGIKTPSIITPESKSLSLPEFIEHLSYGRKYNCPICGWKNRGENLKNDACSCEYEIAARSNDRTIAYCKKCGIYFFHL